MSTSASSFTGRGRQKKTSWRVRVSEVLSRLVITVGGIGTIVAVLLVCIFLAIVVIPLFMPAKVGLAEDHAAPWPTGRLVHTGMDDGRLLGYALSADGTLFVYRLDTGKLLDRRPLFPGEKMTAFAWSLHGDDVAFGFANGSYRLGQLGFTSANVSAAELREKNGLADLELGQSAEHKGGLVVHVEPDRWQLTKVKVIPGEPIKGTTEAAVRLLDLTIRPKGPILASLTADGKLRVQSVVERENFETGEKVKTVSGGEVALPKNGRGEPAYLLLSGVGDNVLLAWEDGHALRYTTTDIENPKVAEALNLLGDSGLKLTAVHYLIGKGTILAGDSSGRVRAWFRARPESGGSGDGSFLIAGHEFAGSGQAVTSLTASERGRVMVAGFADGHLRVYQVTSERLLADVGAGSGRSVLGVRLAPKENGLLAVTEGGLSLWDFQPRHPEITPKALLQPVWYEGYERPEHVWQATGGTDDFEPKFGLWSLIFGTIKATVYSLLMGVPLALLAAVYTSEFLHPKAKAFVKPTIELMASLPSVVLGFLAALVFAPIVERVLPAVLAGFLTVPAAFMLGAYVWQLLPEKWSLLLARYRFPLICTLLAPAFVAAALLGPGVEWLLFNGDIKAWLNGRVGSATSGWFVILLPLGALATAFFLGQVVNPRLRSASAHWGRTTSAVLELAKFFAAAVVAVLISLALGGLLTGLGLDPRGSVVSTYEQRNALVVGFVMGFAIIPIIYTLAEDALSAVPEHLRSASLGCGATPWQTATRIIIPTAMSGLFSAVMIGLGRAVGETMIVLMAAGNTPVLDMNVFNGFRTLSANIATELPDAVRDSSHYRTLFLAAFTLFAMTFVLNTIAEMVRQRFRKRAYQL